MEKINEIIYLNVGGTSFKVHSNTLKNRLPNAKLAKFAQVDHLIRIQLCDSYFTVNFKSILFLNCQ